MDIDDQLDSLHLSEPSYSKRRRLSGIFITKRNPISPSNDDSDLLESPKNENISILREDNSSLNEIDEKPSVRRSGRKKSAPVRWDGKNNLSIRNSPTSDNLAAIEKYYLDKTIKKSTTSLETIFEETQENKSSLRNIMSVRKLRRSINFSEKVNPGKIKKRQMKASKTNSRKRLLIKSTLEDLHKKLLMVEQD